MQTVLYEGCLNADSIDGISEEVAQNLESLQVNSREILKIRLSIEDILGTWAVELGEEVSCRMLQSKRFGKTTFILRVDGKAVDPTQYQDDLLLSIGSNPNMVTALGLPVEYRYNGGCNELWIRLPSRNRSSIRFFLTAILSAFVLGIFLRILLPGSAAALSEQLFIPLINTITNILNLISGPLVLLSVLSGIIGVGDVSSFGKIGGTLIRRFLFITLLFAVLIWLSVCWLFPISSSSKMEGSNIFSNLFQLILDIVPQDIVSPFQTGNALQIIFIAICCGSAAILLGDLVPDVIKIINQINAIIQKLVINVSRLLPLFVFLCIVNLILSSNPSVIYQFAVPFLTIVAINFILPLIYGFYASLKTHIPFKQLIHSQLPTFLLAITTASSSSVLYSSMECCTEKLHIDKKFVSLGVPFGQILFMPGVLASDIIFSLFMAKQNAILITPQWLFSMLILSSIMSIATPPIPGSGISSLLVLFSQLGIPTSTIAICAPILSFTDYTETACNIACLQQTLLIGAKKQGMIKSDRSTSPDQKKKKLFK